MQYSLGMDCGDWLPFNLWMPYFYRAININWLMECIEESYARKFDENNPQNGGKWIQNTPGPQ